VRSYLACFFVLVFTTSGELRAQCPIEPTTVFFINGINSLAVQADDNRRILDKKIRETLGNKYGDVQITGDCLNTEVAYNPTGGIIPDLLESFEQVCESDQDPHASEASKAVLGWLGLADNTGSLCQPQKADLKKYFKVTNLSEDTLDLIKVYAALYHAKIQRDNRDVILVSHSQGNLFANLEYEDAGLSDSDRARIHIVAVATPSDHVDGYMPGNERYVTLTQDVIASQVFPIEHLSPNSDNPNCMYNSDDLCHDFLDSYLNNEDSGTKILNHIIDTMRAAAWFTFVNQTQFNNVANPNQTASFNAFPVGFYPSTALRMGLVTVQLTNAGSAPIFGPSSGGFTTNFLSTGVRDDENNIIISFPASTTGAGFKIRILSDNPVTVVATDFDNNSSPKLSFSSMGSVGFVGFSSVSGVKSIRISAPIPSNKTYVPIANIGDITFRWEVAPW
jgi:hypothetical protein